MHDDVGVDVFDDDAGDRHGHSDGNKHGYTMLNSNPEPQTLKREVYGAEAPAQKPVSQLQRCHRGEAAPLRGGRGDEAQGERTQPWGIYVLAFCVGRVHMGQAGSSHSGRDFRPWRSLAGEGLSPPGSFFRSPGREDRENLGVEPGVSGAFDVSCLVLASCGSHPA